MTSPTFEACASVAAAAYAMLWCRRGQALQTQSTASAENICLTNVRLSSADVGTGCNSSYFQIGFLNDSEW